MIPGVCALLSNEFDGGDASGNMSIAARATASKNMSIAENITVTDATIDLRNIQHYNWTHNGNIDDGASNGYGSIYTDDGKWNMIKIWSTTWDAETWNGSRWVDNNSLEVGLRTMSCTVVPEIFDYFGDLWLIHGNCSGAGDGTAVGYIWNGTAWENNNSITKGIDIGNSALGFFAAFNESGTIKLLAYPYYSPIVCKGYKWQSSQWTNEDAICNGVSDITQNDECKDAGNDCIIDPEIYWNDGQNNLLISFAPSVVGNPVNLKSYKRSGSNWVQDTSISEGLGDFVDHAFYNVSGDIYLLRNGNVGYQWNAADNITELNITINNTVVYSLAGDFYKASTNTDLNATVVQNCYVDSSFCQFDFYSDTAGILQYLDINITYTLFTGSAEIKFDDTSTWTTTMSDYSWESKNYLVNNTGTGNATNCNASYGSGYSFITLPALFDLNANSSTTITINISNPTQSVADYLDITCDNNGGGTISTTTDAPLALTTVISGGGGGGDIYVLGIGCGLFIKYPSEKINLYGYPGYSTPAFDFRLCNNVTDEIAVDFDPQNIVCELQNSVNPFLIGGASCKDLKIICTYPDNDVSSYLAFNTDSNCQASVAIELHRVSEPLARFISFMRDAISFRNPMSTLIFFAVLISVGMIIITIAKKF